MELKKKNDNENLHHINVGRFSLNRGQAEQSETGRSNEQEFNYHYYEQFKRLYLTGFYLSMQMKQLSHKRDQIWNKVIKLQKKSEEFRDNIRGEPQEKKKRFRRTAEQIPRNYVCSVQICQKSYGSQGSLQQHLKLKHPQLYQQYKPISQSQNQESN